MTLVAGATGYLGRFVAQALAARGLRVRALVRDEAKLALPGQALAPAVGEAVDEMVVGDLTRPESLRGVCDGAAAVFSSVSLMAGRDAPDWHAVDYRGNCNLLREAERAGVRRFVYVSVFNADRLPDVPMVAAHEAFADELAASPIESVVIRPTGYFSDLGTYVRMARSGRVYLLGSGDEKLNPIHGADLAEVCVDALTGPAGSLPSSIDVGGPEVLTQREIAALAANAVCDAGIRRRRPAVTTIPLGIARAVVALVRVFNRQRGDLLRFFVESASMNHVAPAFGSRTLREHFAALVREEPV